MPIFTDSESKQEIYDLIDKFDSSSLFELEIQIECNTKIKMMKLSQNSPDGEAIKVTIEDSGNKKNLELKKDKNVSEGDK